MAEILQLQRVFSPWLPMFAGLNSMISAPASQVLIRDITVSWTPKFGARDDVGTNEHQTTESLKPQG